MLKEELKLDDMPIDQPLGPCLGVHASRSGWLGIR
ncbi:hypothetical protein ABIF90_008402 [Bradyrhizobium japonicum]